MGNARSHFHSPQFDAASATLGARNDWLLAEGDLIVLTGYVVPSAQRRWLDRQGLRYLVDAAGRPKVSREAVDRLLGVSQESQPTSGLIEAQTAVRARPNFAALESTATSGARTASRNAGKDGRRG